MRLNILNQAWEFGQGVNQNLCHPQQVLGVSPATINVLECIGGHYAHALYRAVKCLKAAFASTVNIVVRLSAVRGSFHREFPFSKAKPHDGGSQTRAAWIEALCSTGSLFDPESQSNGIRCVAAKIVKRQYLPTIRRAA